MRNAQIAFLSILTMSACQSSKGTAFIQPAQSTRIKGSSDVSICSWNVALAPGMNIDAARRTPYVIEYLRTLLQRCDVISLQEVWRPQDAKMIIKTLGLRNDQWHYVDSRTKEVRPGDHCRNASSTGMKMCTKKTCRVETNENETICAKEECGLSLAAQWLTDVGCFNCMVAGVGHTADEIYQRCVHGAGASYVYDGGNGTMIITRLHLGQKDALRLPTSNAIRLALKATLYGAQSGPVTIVSVHLSSSQVLPPTHEPFSTWEEEKIAQLRAVHDFAGPEAMIVGDLNAGPNFGELSGESPGVWNEVLRLGYTSPLAGPFPAQCTVCPDNLLRFDASTASAIDHILLSKVLRKRFIPIFVHVLSQPTLEYCRPGTYVVCKKRFTAPISDHEPIIVGFTVRNKY